MKIAIISTMQIYPWGGSEELWYHTALKAREQGYEVDCFLYAHKQKPLQHSKLMNEGVRIYYIPIVKGRFAGIRKKLQSVILSHYKKIADGEYDKILISQGGTFELFNNPSLLNALELIKGDDITIVSHGNQYGLVLTDTQRALAAQFFTRVKHACFISEWALHLTESQILHKLKNADIVLNPFKQSTHTSYPALTKPLRMAMVSSLTIQWKGQDTLLQILGSDAWKTREWQLEIYGEGSDKLYLEKLILFYGLEDKVKLMGHENDPGNIWSQNSILMVPSRVDNVPISLTEAMACSRTAMITDVGGMTEWIDNTIGFVAEGPGFNAIANTMEKLWIDKDSLIEKGKLCRRRIEEKTHNKSFSLLHLM